MVEKITVSLNDDGFWIVNVGDTLIMQSKDRRDVLALINDNLNKLAYFPTHQNDLQANCVSYEDFKKNQAKNKKKL